jgi:hypothetical protein
VPSAKPTQGGGSVSNDDFASSTSYSFVAPPADSKSVKIIPSFTMVIILIISWFYDVVLKDFINFE